MTVEILRVQRTETENKNSANPAPVQSKDRLGPPNNRRSPPLLN